MNRQLTEFQTFISDSLGNQLFTEDAPIIEEHVNHYVFVYGTSMGQISSHLVNDKRCLYRGMATTMDKIYRIIEYRGGLKTRYVADPSGLFQIRGELWDISTEALYELDIEESNSLITVRQRIPVRTEDGQPLSAWAYLAEEDLIKDNAEKIFDHVNIVAPGVLMVRTHMGVH